MSDSESEESNKPGCSGSESGHPGQSSEDNQKRLGIQMFSHSVSHGKSIVVPTGGSIELKPSTRSAHQQGNWEGHVQPEEAGSNKGGEFIETPTPTSQSPQ